MQYLEQLKASAFSGWLSTSMAGFPTLIALHSVGMAFVVGLSMIVSLRLFRPLPGITPELLPRLLTVAIAGFTLNLVTGILLFITRALEYFTSGIFISKMLLVLTGTAALLVLQRRLSQFARLDRRARALSITATACLFGAVVTGRLIAYLSDIYR